MHAPASIEAAFDLNGASTARRLTFGPDRVETRCPMTRRRYTDAFISAVLAAANRRDRPLAEVLAEYGVPERTYHHWRRRFPSAEGDAVDAIRCLEKEVRALRRENQRLLHDLALQRELLGKPWRRLLPGEPPSATRNETPE